MIQKSLRTLTKLQKSIAAGIAVFGLIVGISLAVPTPAAFAADATYSCGTYGSGSYNDNTNCAGATSGGTTSGTDGANVPGAPNTGFAKLMQPQNLTAVIGSLVILAFGIGMIIRARSHKKQNVSFDERPKN